MSNIVQRNMHRSLAKSLIELEEEFGIPLNKLVKLTNDKFGYVDKDDPKALATLERQMELDIAAERHAKDYNVKVNDVAVIRTAVDRKMKTLGSGLQLNAPEPKLT